jgi:hypothetical protein
VARIPARGIVEVFTPYKIHIMEYFLHVILIHIIIIIPEQSCVLFFAPGPLLCEKDGKWYLHGISSFGHDACAIAYKYGVYTRVSQFKTWIKKVTGIDC